MNTFKRGEDIGTTLMVLANGEINGKPVTFMLDTGATGVALSDAANEFAPERGASLSEKSTCKCPDRGSIVSH
jgi:hypothetical protein